MASNESSFDMANGDLQAEYMRIRDAAKRVWVEKVGYTGTAFEDLFPYMVRTIMDGHVMEFSPDRIYSAEYWVWLKMRISWMIISK